ncbi:tripartite tricarboxylate transporter TctB family protein [Streptomyces sp. NBC_01795]|uniref:tripartite tricarboxylate transporter TctB family protein n=1 Tax=Streptomyces sp. NBC_01795 TaxID=2975943 RepID=UPI002DD7BD86|nr:tripartite tricarboxylate transporter TctB family protein [Streptomyces sp. NBC_01795]WSA93775.1 tripartite tricarboxylate transporter TctB family protein [Streptomyces sp. NBC_01795]
MSTSDPGRPDPTPPPTDDSAAPRADGSATTSTSATPPPSLPGPGSSLAERLKGRSELGVCALLLCVGALVLGDALTMDTVASARGPVGPRTVPLVVGVALLVVSVLLAVDVLRGGRGEAGAGEDVDTSEPGDWRTVALLAGVFLAFAALIEPLGFPLSGALLFWGSAFALGSRTHAFTRDPLIAAGLSLFTYAVFHLLLGVPLPGGPLMGVL